MGPGPVDVYPRVLRAMSIPLQGQFDPQFTAYMNEVMALYRQVFRTANKWTFLIDGTARAGIETCLASVLAPEEIEAAILRHRPKMIAMSHGDTSTTMLQPLAGVGALCRKHDVLLYVDATASLGGNEFEMDAW